MKPAVRWRWNKYLRCWVIRDAPEGEHVRLIKVTNRTINLLGSDLIAVSVLQRESQ